MWLSLLWRAREGRGLGGGRVRGLYAARLTREGDQNLRKSLKGIKWENDVVGSTDLDQWQEGPWQAPASETLIWNRGGPQTAEELPGVDHLASASGTLWVWVRQGDEGVAPILRGTKRPGLKVDGCTILFNEKLQYQLISLLGIMEFDAETSLLPTWLVSTTTYYRII